MFESSRDQGREHVDRARNAQGACASNSRKGKRVQSLWTNSGGTSRLLEEC